MRIIKSLGRNIAVCSFLFFFISKNSSGHSVDDIVSLSPFSRVMVMDANLMAATITLDNIAKAVITGTNRDVTENGITGEGLKPHAFLKVGLSNIIDLDKNESVGELDATIHSVGVAPPVFESSTSAVIEEATTITTTVLDVNANDGSGNAADANVSYSLSGTDAGDFNINASTGLLTFAAVPNWSAPADADANNIYELTVSANNGSSTTTQDIKIYVFPKNGLTGSEIVTQLGLDLDGEAALDQSGSSVSLSADGKTMAIGASGNDDNGLNSGHVRIYRYNGTAWVQLGSDIDGEAAGDLSGSSVSLSADGKTVAIGAPSNADNGSESGHVRIYTYNGTAWVQLGTDIDGEAEDDQSGRSVSLSADGKTVAIGAYGNDGNGFDSGHVRIYTYNGSAWVKLGLDIDGEAANDQSGTSVSLSADGKTVAIGASYNAGNGSFSGHVRIYTYNGSAWVKLGLDIDGEAAHDRSGNSVSLSADGKTVAIGAYLNTGNGDYSGHVRIYTYNGTAWVQLGADIDGEAAYDFSGISVSLNADGKTVAIGAYNNDGNGADSGHVRIYTYNGTAWVQLGADLNGEAAGDQSGISVSLNADGKTVAIGAYNNDGNGSNSGHVRVYKLALPPPVFESSTSAVIEEATTTATTILDINANDGVGGVADANVTYSLSGTDVGDFNINASTGQLTFAAVPNWSAPADADANNIYELTVTANNGSSTTTQDIKIYVFPKNGLTGSEIAKQLGLDLDGEAAYDQSSYSVSLSADGKTVAIGAPYNDGNGSESGHVRIYGYNGTAWAQLGTDLNGEAEDDQSGRSVSLSADGKTVAIGALYNYGNGDNSGHVRIYRFNGTAWVQLGTDIDGEAEDDQSGRSVSLSADGKTVAIGAPLNDGNGRNSGHVRIYTYNGSAWVKLGLDIDGEAEDDQSGTSVSLSADGKTVAIGATGNDGNGSYSGHVRIYTYNGTAWVQMGADIDGEAAIDRSGNSVSLSADGKTAAIGAPYNSGNGSFSGHVRIYTYNGTAWAQLGADIDGEAANDYSGYSVSLSADGKTVAIGAINNAGNGVNSGHVRIYRYNGTAWVQLGADLNGEAAGDQSGISVSLNADGKTVAIGAYHNDGNGSNSGHVRVYKLALPLPVFESSTSAVIEEATTIATTVLDVNANDGSGGVADANVTYSLSGTDGGDFNINASTGLLTFAAVPNWSAPADADTNNIYELTVTANNGSSTTTQDIKIYVFPKNGLTGREIATQLGIDLDGEATLDQSGSSVSLSADGKTMAIGASGNDDNGLNSGHVRIYRYNGTAWVQLGSDIDGEAAGDQSGSSVSLSADGKTVAIGAMGNDGNGGNSGHVRIYTYNGTAWLQLGADLDGEAAGDQSGKSVSLSADGKTVAIGATGNDGNGSNSGHVRIYKYNGSAWVKLGADIDGEAANDQSGTSVSLSADGKTVAIGASYNAGNGSFSGHVRIYTYNGSAWVKLGLDIDGEAVSDNSGWSVSLSADGKTVAIGAYGNDGNGAYSGHVRIYGYNGAAWLQLGSDLDGEAVGDNSGWSVSLSADGKTVAIGANNNDGNGADSGHVRIYGYNGTAWVQVAADLDGEATSDQSGYSVSLSADGKRVAIGAPYNGGSGHVRVYELVLPVPIFESLTSAVIEEATTIATTVLDVNANDGAGNAADANVTYSLSGTDAGDFNINANTGLLTFAVVPNWSTPADADANNIYELTVTADNGSITTTQDIKIYVFPKNGLTGSEIAKQLGLDLDGEAADDKSGYSLSLSADGKTVAIGAPYNDGNGSNSGHVRIYKYNGTAWVQLGSDIDGDAANDQSGYSLSLSADGKTVAIGAPYNTGNGFNSGHVRIYTYNGTAWVQLGADLNGEAANDESGYTVSLSADGKTVAIGAYGNAGNGSFSGHVRIYGYNGTAWVKLGLEIDGEATGDYSGFSVSLSADGKTVAIGAIGNDGNGSLSGHVRIYGYNGTAWVQMGVDIDGEAANDRSGYSVSLSADGKTVAIGAYGNDGNGPDSGHVRIYTYNGTAWAQLGADIDGEAAGDYSGYSVSLSADGKTVAIGAPSNAGNGVNSGHVRIYRYNGTAWIQLALDLDGEAAGDQSGYSVSLSADGKTVAIGAFTNASNGADSGHVRVYELVPTVTLTQSTTTFAEGEGTNTITATLSAVSGQDVTVTIGVKAGGTATETTDFTLSSTSIVIAAGTTTGTAILTAVQDALDEVNETITIEITGVTNGAEDGTQEVTSTIIDDDAAPTVTLTQSTTTFAEAEGTNTITATLSAVSGQDVTVTIGVKAGGTATETTDFTLSSTSIVIAAGTTTGTAILTAVQDALDEVNETITIEITGVTNGAEDGTQEVTSTIIDDDAAPTVTLTQSTTTFAEGEGTNTITATLSAVSGQDVTVTIGVKAGGTATETTDFTLSSTSIVIAAGTTTGTAILTAVQDVLDEVNETITIEITGVTNGAEDGTQEVTSTITDDDAAPTVTLTQSTTTFAEAEGTNTITATLSAVSGQDVTVTIGVKAGGTATETTDFTLSSTSIVIAAGTTTGTAILTAVQDALDEVNETITIEITGVTNGAEDGTQEVTSTITDDDAAPTVTLTQSTTTFAEGEGTNTITATLSAVSGQDVTVTIGVKAGGTATETTDFTLSSTSIVIAAGTTTGTAILTAVQDVLDEVNETITIEITAVTNGVEDGTQEVTSTIIDDDAAPTVTLSVGSLIIAEAAGTSTITATLSAVSSQDVTVTLAYSGTATNGTDYNSSASTSITITAGNLSANAAIGVIAIQDINPETNETIIIDIVGVTNGTENGTQQQTITITDDDTPNVLFA
ncbi:beta strand repeat-containing protein, partial [Roseivirga echinicomitans]